MKTLNNLVEEILKTHEGGQGFFDKLDEELRSRKWCSLLYHLSLEDYHDCIPKIVLSGRFGQLFNNWLQYEHDEQRTILVVRGGLSYDDAELEDLYDYESIITGQNFIFFDDSFYSGNTRNAIKKHIEDLGGNLIKSYVIYDGSKEREKDVVGMYRYYDHHKGV